MFAHQYRIDSPSGVVRPGHFATLDYMTTPQFQEVKALFESVKEFGGVYFRPIDNRLTVLDLSPKSRKPRIGVGKDPYVPVGARAADLRPTMADRVAYLEGVRRRQTRVHAENYLEAALIRSAQGCALRLPGFPGRLRFINSQWRLQGLGSQQFADLIAVDLPTRRLVIIELKRKRDDAAFDQVAEYVDWFDLHADELRPFFLRLARVMGQLYSCPELAGLDGLRSSCVGLVAWMGWFRLKVFGLEQLDHPVDPWDEPVDLAEAIDEDEWDYEVEVEDDDHRGLGPQAASDNAFTRRMRRHQSWYRDQVLGLPYGTGPWQTSTTRYGNMLTREDGDLGKNFLTEEIFEVAIERLVQGVGTIDQFRLIHNMLSSQPMCFNLFGPQVRDLDLGTLLWRRILGDEVAQVVRVAIEWAPSPSHEYLHDNTAFDAFVEYRRPDGKLAFVGIETKLTEPFSRDHYDSDAYRRWMTQDAPWRLDVGDRVADIRHNQLWRDHLLVVAMLHHPRSRHASGRFMLVRHPGDTACEATVAGYRSLLRPDDQTFVDMPLDQLVAAWQQVVPDHARAWLDAFNLRYLELAESEA